MAEIVGGALLSSFLQVLFERLTSREVLEIIRWKKSTKKSLHRLQTTLYPLRAVLVDAEQKQIRDPEVKNWLDQLKDVVYHADDLVDEISTRAATQKKLTKLLFCFLKLNDRAMETRMEDIIGRLELIQNQVHVLGLRENQNTLQENWLWRPQSTSLVEESDVFGRTSDKENIIKLLLSDDINDSNISVIPIVGMGGIGKTTLAQLAYNDSRVKEKFNPRAWVCVSGDFDISRITKSIIEDISSRACGKIDLNPLQLDLKEKLTDKKFLIVLDDIWNENYDEWDLLQRPFQSGMKGSKVLVTTRSEIVASKVQNSPTYQITHLSDEDCWSLLANHAFLSKQFVVNSHLEEIGRNIAKKCKGLPLIAKTLGGLLRSKPDIECWNTILKSDIWDLPEKESKIVPALRISYHYLSPNLKACFVYCSLFPKGYNFQKHELILMWMAEGFLQPPMGEKTLEEIGEVYFHDLSLRSFFQRSNVHGYFVMHDLIHDLATFEARGFYFGSDQRWTKREITSMTRHVWHSFDRINFEDLGEAKSLRTLVMDACKMPYFHQLCKLKCLRVVSFKGNFNLKALPDSIAKLINLRYMDLTDTCIENLPKSFCDLYNLQTLILANCHSLSMLPSNMHKLVNLRYLDISDTRNLKGMPRGIGKLKDLQFLSDFVVGKDKGASVKELGDLKNLHKSLRIRNLPHCFNGMESSEGMLMDLVLIEDLQIEWSDGMDDSPMQNDVLDKLQPHKHLKSLFIGGYGGTRFASWLGCRSYCNMSNVNLVGCKYCTVLPPLGQLPSLNKLCIQRFDGLEQISSEFYRDDSSSVTSFPSLEYLEFRDMYAWKEWPSFDMDAFPKLRELILVNCTSFIGVLPKHLPSLETHVIDTCLHLASFSIDNFSTLKKLLIIHCENLKTISISKGQSQILQEVTIFRCKNLKTVTISKSPRQNLSRVIIQHCENLQTVTISKSPDQNLGQVIIQHCKNLQIVSISKSPHQNLSQVIIQHCENLQTVSISKSPHQHLGEVIIEHCKNLQTVSISKSPHQHLSEVIIQYCENLQTVSVSKSPHQNLSQVIIQHCKNLQTVSIFKNPHQNLSQVIIQHCKNLQTVSISKNPHQNLDQVVIQHCANLQSVSFSKSRDQNLEQAVILHCENLQTVSFSRSQNANFSIHDCKSAKLIFDDCVYSGN